VASSPLTPEQGPGDPWLHGHEREIVLEVPDTLRDAFLAIDRHWRITYASCREPGSARCQPAELVGKHLRTVLPEEGDVAARRWAELCQCMQERVSTQFLEHRSVDDSWSEVRAYPEPQGGIGVIFRDVTEQRRNEAQMRAMLQGAQQAQGSLLELVAAVGNDLSERKGAEAEAKKRAELEQQLIGIVSHDLRNPLQAIRLNAALGLRSATGSDPQLARRFERILTSSDRAARMIDDLLDFSRARVSGGIAVDPKPIDLHGLTNQVVEEVLSTRPERQVSREISGDGRGSWDADRLAQVVQNLVGNALQHTTETTLVRVTTRGDASHVFLEVHNDGPPIPSSDLPGLFEPFKRARSSQRATSGRSLGLGLYITSLIVDAHYGTVTVRSTSDEGTTFTVRLPREPPGSSERGQDP
jgi:sigma-B regulation protein RsbU (phosphoserine phosphatase)